MWGRTWPDAINTGILTKSRRRSTPTSSTRPPRSRSRSWCASTTRSAAIFWCASAAAEARFFVSYHEPFAKIVINFVARNGGEPEKLEFLGDGQQVVVDGIHPDTGKPYAWFGGEPGPIAREELPYIREAEARELIERAAELLVAEFGYSAPASGRARQAAPATTRTATAAPPTGNTSAIASAPARRCTIPCAISPPS